MLRDVERKRRLSDRWTGCQDHEVRWLKAAKESIQLGEAGGHAEDLAAVLVQVLEPVVCLAQEDRQRLEATIRAPLADLEQDGFGPIDGDLGVVGLLVADRCDPARGADEVAQHRLALDDPAVVLGVHRGRHRVHERGQVRRAADGVELVAPPQLVAEGDEVDRLPLAMQGEHRLVHIGVLLAVEVGRLEEVPHAQDGIRVDEDRAEDALLCLDRLRSELVDTHRRIMGTARQSPGRGRAERPAGPG